mgnify:CR=1 FL=1
MIGCWLRLGSSTDDQVCIVRECVLWVWVFMYIVLSWPVGAGLAVVIVVSYTFIVFGRIEILHMRRRYFQVSTSIFFDPRKSMGVLYVEFLTLFS